MLLGCRIATGDSGGIRRPDVRKIPAWTNLANRFFAREPLVALLATTPWHKRRVAP